MNPEGTIVIRIRRGWLVAAAGLLAVGAFLVVTPLARAQKIQEAFKDKINISEENGGIGVATSADGKYVYVAGPQGVVVSDDFGKVGSWSQTARFK